MLRLDKVSKDFLTGRRKRVQAVKSASFTMDRGEVVGLMGNSGCGKSTTALLACRLLNPTHGAVIFEGTDVTDCRRKGLTDFRMKVQIVFQDPVGAFDPMRTIDWSLREAVGRMEPGGGANASRQKELCQIMDFPLRLLDRHPTEMSGGELQRAAIVRSLMVHPKLLLLDEPTSMLDLSTQAQISRGILSIVALESVGVLWITHDDTLAKVVCDRVLMMKDGIVEQD